MRRERLAATRLVDRGVPPSVLFASFRTGHVGRGQIDFSLFGQGRVRSGSVGNFGQFVGFVVGVARVPPLTLSFRCIVLWTRPTAQNHGALVFFDSVKQIAHLLPAMVAWDAQTSGVCGELPSAQDAREPVVLAGVLGPCSLEASIPLLACGAWRVLHRSRANWARLLGQNPGKLGLLSSASIINVTTMFLRICPASLVLLPKPSQGTWQHLAKGSSRNSLPQVAKPTGEAELSSLCQAKAKFSQDRRHLSPPLHRFLHRFRAVNPQTTPTTATSSSFFNLHGLLSEPCPTDSRDASCALFAQTSCRLPVLLLIESPKREILQFPVRIRIFGRISALTFTQESKNPRRLGSCLSSNSMS
jgi:hypothetical protein